MSTFLLSALLLFAQTAGTISGRITTADKNAAAGIRVMAVAVPDDPARADNAIMSIVQTDKSGNYRLENVPPGRYYITTGFVEVPTFYPGVTEQISARIVNVTAGSSLRGMDFAQIRPAALKITGRVVRVNAQPFQPMPGSDVRLYVRGIPPVRTLAGSDGTFEFNDVRPGSYNVSVSGRVNAGMTPVVVKDANVTGLELQVIPRNEVTGRIVVEGGGPIPRVTLLAEESGGTVQMPLSDRTFSLSLDGEPRISILPGSLAPGYSVRSLTYGRTDLLKEPLRNTFSQSDELVLTLRSPNVPRVTVRGRVLAGDLKVAGGVITLTSPEISETRFAEVRNDGTFAIPGVLPGTYTAKSNFDGASTPSIVVGRSDLRNVEIVVPTPSAASMDPEKLVGALSWVVLDANGATVDRGSRSIRLKDVSLWGPGSKHIALNSQFTFEMGDSPEEYRGGKTFFHLGARSVSGDLNGYEGFKVDSSTHATMNRTPDQLGIEISQVAGRWEVTRTEFVTDVTIGVRRPAVIGLALPLPLFRVVIQKGSVITWPSSVNGKTVAN